MAASSSSERLSELEQENKTLKKQNNEQQQTIKCMYTRLAVIESTLKKGGGDKATLLQRALDAEAKSSELEKENNKLQKKNKELRENLRRANEAIRHKADVLGTSVNSIRPPPDPQASTAKRKKTPGVKTSTPSARSQRPKTPQMKASATKATATADTTNTQTTLDRLREKLDTCEQQIRELSEENKWLRDKLKEQSVDGASSSSESYSQLIQQIREKDSELSILRQRLDYMSSNLESERNVYQRTLDALEQRTEEVRSLRSSLADVQSKYEQLHSYLQQDQEKDSKISQLRSEVSNLEQEKMQLLESPFIRGDQDSEDLSKEVKKLRNERQELHDKLSYLQGTVRDQSKSLKKCEEKVDKYEKQVENLTKDNQKLRVAARAAASGTEALRERLHVFEGVLQMEENGDTDQSKVDSRAMLMDAVADARRRLEKAQSGEHVPEEDDEESVPALKRRCNQLQSQLLATQQAAERSERILSTRSALERDLSDELNEIREGKEREKRELKARAERAEDQCAELRKQLESLKTQLNYRKEKSKIKKSEGEASLEESDASDEASEGSLEGVSTELENFAPGENVMESYVVDGVLDWPELRDSTLKQLDSFGGAEVEWPSNAKTTCTFCTVDFDEYETQTSPLSTAVKPVWNFAVQFRCVNTDFLSRIQHQSSNLKISLHVVVGADFVTVASGEVDLAQLVESRRGKLTKSSLKLISPSTGNVVGTIRVELRLAYPVKELWENEFASGATKRVPKGTDKVVPQDRCYLRVLIDRGSFETQRESISPYIQISGDMSDDLPIFTPVAMDTKGPIWKDESTIALPWKIDELPDEFHGSLLLRIFDDDAEEGSGLMGYTKVDISSLNQGLRINGNFEIIVESDSVESGYVIVEVELGYDVRPSANWLTEKRVSPYLTLFEGEIFGGDTVYMLDVLVDILLQGKAIEALHILRYNLSSLSGMRKVKELQENIKKIGEMNSSSGSSVSAKEAAEEIDRHCEIALEDMEEKVKSVFLGINKIIRLIDGGEKGSDDDSETDASCFARLISPVFLRPLINVTEKSLRHVVAVRYEDSKSACNDLVSALKEVADQEEVVDPADRRHFVASASLVLRKLKEKNLVVFE